MQVLIGCLWWNFRTTSALAPHASSRSVLRRDNLQGVYTYSPDQFDMYRNCKELIAAQLPKVIPYDTYSNPKHNMDVLFVRSLTTQTMYAQTLTSDPAKAELFAVPVFWTQSSHGHCGNHNRNREQLLDVLSKSPWYTRNHGKDHVLVCDEFPICNKARDDFPNMIFGAFEKALQGKFGPYPSGVVLPIGYSTYSALGWCDSDPLPDCSRIGQCPFKPMADRKFLITSIGQTAKKLYKRRAQLWCDWVETEDKPKGFLIQANEKTCTSPKEDAQLTGRMDKCESFDVMYNSRMMISFSGDTPTTDRIFNSFESLTPIVVLSEQKQAIIETLPARQAVPWSDILLELDSHDFKEAPVKYLEEFVQQISIQQLEHIQKLMEDYRQDVLWHIDGSRAAEHFLMEAISYL